MEKKSRQGGDRPGRNLGNRSEVARSHLKRADPVLARLIEAHPAFDPRAWLSGLPAMDAFGTLIFQVIGQQLSVKATRSLISRLSESFGGRLPTPEEFLATSPEDLRKVGLSRRKVSTLHSVAERFVDERFSAGLFETLSDVEIEERLTALSGIGPWTVQGFLIIALGRDDVVLPGDLALRKCIQKVYGLEKRPTPDEVVRIADRWRPYRSLAVAYLFQEAFTQNEGKETGERGRGSGRR